jgi:hypothetical protein
VAAPGNVYRAIDSDREVAADGVQTAGKETLFRRGKTWIANNAKDLDPEKDRSQVQEITRFSDEYFALVESQHERGKRGARLSANRRRTPRSASRPGLSRGSNKPATLLLSRANLLPVPHAS